MAHLMLRTIICIIFWLIFRVTVFVARCWQKNARIMSSMASQAIERPKNIKHSDIEKTRKDALNVDMDRNSNDIFGHLMPFHYKYSQICGRRFVSRWGLDTMLNVTEPELIYEVLSTRFASFQKSVQQRKFMAPLMGRGIGMAIGTEWQSQRRYANPAFHHQKNKMMISTMASSFAGMIKEWKKNIDMCGGSAEIEVYSQLSKTGAEIIARTGFGSECNRERYARLQMRLQDLLFSSPIWCLIPRYSLLPTSRNREMARVQEELHAFINEMIEKRRNAKKSSSEGSLGILLKVSEVAGGDDKKNKKLLMDQCKTFFFAGHETTSALLTWTMMQLGLHEEWQQKAYEEIREAYGDGSPDPKTLSRLKTVTMILQESLRRYPPAIQLSREAVTDLELGNGTTCSKLLVPKELSIHMNILAVHIDPQVWGPNALEFRPERFSHGVNGACNKRLGAFVPFGLGSRVCMGQAFAMTEAKIAMCLMLQHLRWSLSPNYRHAPAFGVTLHLAMEHNLLFPQDETTTNQFCLTYVSKLQGLH